MSVSVSDSENIIDIENTCESNAKVEVSKDFECSICQDLLIQPVTLPCQHTFCRSCIKSYVVQQSKDNVSEDGFQRCRPRNERNPKCPLCRCTIAIPPNDNFILKRLIEEKYPELSNERCEQAKRDLLKLDIRSQIEDEIRNEVFGAFVDEAVHESNSNSNGNGNEIDEDIRPIMYPSSSNNWIKRVFGNKMYYSMFSGCLFLVAMLLMVKKNVSLTTYMCVMCIMWSLFTYFLFSW